MRRKHFIIQFKQRQKRKIDLPSGTLRVTMPGQRWRLWVPVEFPTILDAVLHIRESTNLYTQKPLNLMRIIVQPGAKVVVGPDEIKRIIKSRYRTVKLKCGLTL